LGEAKKKIINSVGRRSEMNKNNGYLWKVVTVSCSNPCFSSYIYSHEKRCRSVFLKLFYSIASFSLSTRRFGTPKPDKANTSEFKEFYLKKKLNSGTKSLIADLSNCVTALRFR